MNLHPADYDKAQAILVQELVALRQRASLTQRELAQRAGLLQTSIQRIEHGQRRVDLVELAIICTACGESFMAFCERFAARCKKRRK